MHNHVGLSPAQSHAQRVALFERQRDALIQVALRALHQEKRRFDTFFGLVVAVDDPLWNDVAEHLLPDHDWEPMRAQGEAIGIGTVSLEIAQVVARRVEGSGPFLTGTLAPGRVRVLTLSHGGALVCDLVVIPPDALNMRPKTSFIA